MKIQTDSEGFLIGGKREDWKAATAKWDAILMEVRAIRRLLGSAGGAKLRKPAASPQVQRKSADGDRQASAKALRAAAAAAMAVTTGPVATPNQRAVPGSNRFAPTPGSARERDERGRFKSAAAMGGAAASPNVQAARDPDSKVGNGRLKAALRELAGGGAGDISQVDPVIAASREIKEVVEPVGRAFGKLFGRDPEKKKAGWFKRILDSLKMLPVKIADKISLAVPGNQAAGGGLLGDIGGGLMRRFAAPVLAGGATLAGAGATGLAAAGRFAVKRAPFLGTAFGLGSGYLSDRSIANDKGMTAEQRTEMRVGNAGATAGNVGGAVVGGIVGGAIGGPIGAALGAVVGPMLVRGLSKVMSPLIGDAVDFIRETGSKIAELTMTAIGWLGQLVDAVVDKAKQAGAAAANKAKEVKDAAVNSAPMQALFGSSGEISGLGQNGSVAYLNELARKESGGQLNAEERRGMGYIGKYQMGAAALSDAGLMDPEVVRKAQRASGDNWEKGGQIAFLKDGKNWKDGKTFDGFMSDAAMQEAAVVKYTNINIKRGIKSGALSGRSSRQEIAGYAGAAHLGGSGGADDLVKMGKNVKDANGSGVASYYRDMAAAVGSSVTSTAPNEIAMPAVGAPQSVAMPRASTVMPPQMRAQPPMVIPDAPRQTTPVSSNVNKTTVLGPQQDVGQNMKDRNLAHIQTGGLGQ